MTFATIRKIGWFLFWLLSAKPPALAGVFETVETLRADASMNLYKTFSSQNCRDNSGDSASNSEKMLHLPRLCESRKFFNHTDVQKLSEAAFFDWAGHEQLKINRCDEKSLKTSLQSGKLQAAIIEDLKITIPLLRSVQQHIQDLEGRIRQADDTRAGQAFTGDLSSIDAVDSVDSGDLEKKLIEAKKQKASIMASLWHGSHPVMNAWLLDLAKSKSEISQAQLISQIQKMIEFNQKSDKDLMEQTSRSGERYVFNKLDTSTKKGLLNNPAIWQHFEEMALKEKDLNFNEITCRLQGKYGTGDDYLDTATEVASFAVGGGASLLLQAPRFLMKGLALSTKAQKMTHAAGKVLLLGATATDALGVLKEFDNECLSQRPEILQSASNSCELSSDTLREKFEIASLKESQCALMVSLNSVPGIASLASYLQFKKFIKSAPSSNSNRTTDRLVNGERRTDQFRHPEIIGLPDDVVPMVVDSVPNLPPSMRIKGRTTKEGDQQLFAEYTERLPSGELKRASPEVQIDPRTGALDTNFPGSRNFFERLAQAKAGKAHFAFIDVGSLRAVNKTFNNGKGTKAGDAYIEAVAEAIMDSPLGKGKITLARQGGDEFALIIDETDPKKVHAILTEIQARVRDVNGKAHKVFREEKKALAKSYGGSENDKKRLAELAKIQQPDISIGSTQIGTNETLKQLGERVESQAREMKIESAVNMARDPSKYQSNLKPETRPHPKRLSQVREPIPASHWSATTDTPVDLDKLSPLKLQFVKVEQRVKDYNISKYRDELGRETFRLEHFKRNPTTNEIDFSSLDIPIRGQTGMLDGTHPYSRKLINDHFGQAPDNFLIVPKLGNLRELNYLSKGTQTGDEVLKIASEAIKKHLRENDLSFKLGGSDFLGSFNNISRSEAEKIGTRIQKAFNEDPRLKKILNEERQSLLSQKSNLPKNTSAEDRQKLEAKIKALEKFDFKFKFQVLGQEDLPSSPTVEDIIEKADDLFENRAPSH